MKKRFLFVAFVFFMASLFVSSYTQAAQLELTYIEHGRSLFTGAAAFAGSVKPVGDERWVLLEVRVHLGAASATSENFTITLDSVSGAAYDALLFSQDMNAVTDVVWHLDLGRVFMPGDELDLAWANTNTETYGVEIIWGKYEK
jgi:hypothetical protein